MDKQITDEKEILENGPIKQYSDKAGTMEVTMSPDGAVTCANQQWLDTTGYAIEDLPGLDGIELIQDAQLPRYFAILDRVKHGEKIELVELILKTKRGSSVSVIGNLEGTFKYRKCIYIKGNFHEVTRGKMFNDTYGVFVQDSPLPIFIVKNGAFRFVNQGFRTATGYSNKELLGTKILDLVHPDDKQFVHQNSVRMLKAKRPWDEDFRLVCKSGEVRWVKESTIPVPYGDGDATMGALVDLTENKMVEKALNEAKNRYQMLFNSAHDALYVYDFQDNILEVNDIACTLLEYSHSELLKMNIRTIVSPRYISLFSKRMSELKSKGYITGETENVTRSGKIIPIEVHSRIIDYNGKKAILTVSRDMSERKLVESIGTSTEVSLDSLLKIAQFKLGQTDDLVDFVLDVVRKLTGSQNSLIYYYDQNKKEFTFNSWVKKPMQECSVKCEQTIYPLDKTGVLGEAVRQRKPIIVGFEQVPNLLKNGYPEGNYRLKNYLAVPVFRRGEIVAIVSVANKNAEYDQYDIQQLTIYLDSVWNVLERLQVEKKLIESEAFNSSLLNNSLAPILVINPDNTIKYVNPALEKLTGFSSEELIGKGYPYPYWPEEKKEIYQKQSFTNLINTTGLENGENWVKNERQLVKKNGESFFVAVAGTKVYNREGNPQYYLVGWTDITDHKKAEESLAKSEERFRLLTENARDMIFRMRFSPDFGFDYISPSSLSITGYPPEEYYADPGLSSRLIHPDDTHILQEIIASKEKHQRVTMRWTKKCGSMIWVEIENTSVFNEVGDLLAMEGTARDVTKRKKAEDALRESESFNSNLLSNSPNPIIVVNPDATIRYINPAVEKLTGFSSQELIGLKPPYPWWLPSDKKGALPGGHPDREIYIPEFKCRKKDGTIFWVSFKYKPVKEGETIKYFLGNWMDITEQIFARDELVKANEQLRELDKMKDNFLSTVSHELRTPLTSIKSFAEILLNYDEDRATQKEFLGIINDESDRLTRLINDFLDLSKIQAGRMQWKTETVSVTEAIRSAANAIRPLIDKSKLELSMDVETGLPGVLSDKDRLIQVVTNLLGNAAKFTPEGGKIAVKAWLKKHDENKVWVIVKVSDSGIGIAPEHHSSIFEKFGQVGDVLKDRPKGTGLGLPICKKIIENYGGKIWVESEIGKGSSFFFSLPVTQEAKKRVASSPVLLPAVPSSKSKTILVVDDESNIRRFITHELSARGHRVIEASGGNEAVELARKYVPDLITLDISMPDLNGFDVTSMLKNGTETKNIPILIISVIEDKQLAKKLGANDYITKPISIEDLVQRVEILLRGKQRQVLKTDDNSMLNQSLEIELQKRGFGTLYRWPG